MQNYEIEQFYIFFCDTPVNARRIQKSMGFSGIVWYLEVAPSSQSNPVRFYFESVQPVTVGRFNVFFWWVFFNTFDEYMIQLCRLCHGNVNLLY